MTNQTNANKNAKSLIKETTTTYSHPITEAYSKRNKLEKAILAIAALGILASGYHKESYTPTTSCQSAVHSGTTTLACR
jgi:hypothetical protein